MSTEQMQKIFSLMNTVNENLASKGATTTDLNNFTNIDVEQTRINLDYKLYPVDPADYLTFKEIKKLVRIPNDSDSFELILSKLKKYFIVVGKKFFVLNYRRVVYEEIDTPDDFFESFILQYIQKSKDNINPEERREYLTDLDKDSRARYNSLSNKTFPAKIKNGFYTNCRVQCAPFVQPGHLLHFNNGKLDLTTGIFSPRVIGVDFIDECINRNFTYPSESSMNKIMELFSKIFPDPEEYKAILYYLGASISGIGNTLTQSVFLKGEGSNGKSFLMGAMKEALGGNKSPYFIQLPPSAFCDSTKQASDKGLNDFVHKKNAKMAVCNELLNDTISASTFKVVSEGNLNLRVLYEDGAKDTVFRGMLFFTMNNLPIFTERGKGTMDYAIHRRIVATLLKSKFVDVDNKEGYVISDEKHIYVKDKMALKNLTDSDLNAIIMLLIPFVRLIYINNEKKQDYVLPESMEAIRQEIKVLSDEMKDFIDSYFEFTNNKQDLVFRDDMLNLYKLYYKRDPKSMIDMNKSLDKHKIKYYKDLTILGKRGWYGHVDEKKGLKIHDNSFTDVQYNIDDDDDDKTANLKKQIHELKCANDVLKGDKESLVKTLDSRDKEIKRLQIENAKLENEINKFHLKTLTDQLQVNEKIHQINYDNTKKYIDSLHERFGKKDLEEYELYDDFSITPFTTDEERDFFEDEDDNAEPIEVPKPKAKPKKVKKAQTKKSHLIVDDDYEETKPLKKAPVKKSHYEYDPKKGFEDCVEETEFDIDDLDGIVF